MTARIPVILDVDTGVDDALALGLAVASPEIELVAVCSVAGNVDIERTTDNSLRVLDWLGASGVPVHRGASHPLAREHRDAAWVHGTNGIGGASLPASERATGADRGPAAVIRHATARPGEIVLVCVGPLTNLAIALNVEPGLPKLLREVIVMGGAYWAPGNVTPDAEYNIWVDPEAAAQVFATQFPRLSALGLDVTHQVELPREAWEIANRANTNPAKLVSQVCRRTFTEREGARMYLHDPLALAVAFLHDVVQWETGTVTVDTGAERPGRTTFSTGGHTFVGRTVDGERFLGLFRERMGIGGMGPTSA